MSVEDFMTRDVITVDPESSLREVASLLSTEHIGGVPVVAGEEVLGVITATDILAFNADSPGSPAGRRHQNEGFGESPEDLAREVEEGDEAVAAYFTGYWEDAGSDAVERFEEIETPEWNTLDEHVASEIMTVALFTVAPDLSIREAARRMLEADVHRALVVEDGRLLGILSSLDILHAVAENGPLD
jgi:CBS domain-containing protein